MKRKIVIPILLLICLLLTSCGQSYSDRSSKSMTSNSFDAAYEMSDESYSTGGDYSSTYISGDKADYSYSFSADGDTKKSKEEMLKYYEEIQDFVDSKDGYIENVYNDYSENIIRDSYISDNAKNYKAQGYLSFTVEIDNEYIPEVLEKLEQICKDNKFVVTQYTQTIYNYKGYKIVDETEDPYYYGEEITEEELARRLKYASLSVRINYYTPRSSAAKFGYSIKQFFSNAGEILVSVISIFIMIAIGLIILYVESIIFYKKFKKMIFKHKNKHPEYYDAKKIEIVNEEKIEE